MGYYKFLALITTFALIVIFWLLSDEKKMKLLYLFSSGSKDAAKVLFDPGQGKYLCRVKKGKKMEYEVTNHKSKAMVFKYIDLNRGERIANECAWQGLGKFYLLDRENTYTLFFIKNQENALAVCCTGCLLFKGGESIIVQNASDLMNGIEKGLIEMISSFDNKETSERNECEEHVLTVILCPDVKIRVMIQP